ncbi:hypothetical protein [Mesorhizobium huakuii]|nr:hypothetical protein [Mesorhizobium huakuii]
MIENLLQIALINRLSAMGTGIEIVLFVGMVAAVTLAGNGRAKV